MAEKFILTVEDYAVFGTMLAISAAIGLFFRIFDRQQESNEDYLLAGKSMSIMPVAFSLMATFMSATTLMGIPAEMYMYGTNMTFMNIGFILGPIISCYVFLPIYFNTGVLTSYEYLERRFGNSTRRILSAIFLLQNVLFNGISLYAPALAMSAVTNLSLWTSVTVIGVVCTFYCTLGGMKAVIWSDVFQSILMYICLLAIIVKGAIDLGGLQNIFKTAYDGGRILLPTFKMDVSRRYTMWSVFLQGLIITTFNYGGGQTQVQRQLTLKNLKRARLSAVASIPMLVSFQLLCCLCGIIFYVYFKECDPLSSPEKPIHSADQMMPYYISTTMRQYPGLAGLCIAGIFSASLSTISSGVNSMAAVTYKDIIQPLWPNSSGSVHITRIATVFYGALSVVTAFLVASLGNLIKATVLISGMGSGPTLGVYILAVLTTTTNEMGVNLGVLAGYLFAGCASFIPNERYYPQLPVGSNCSNPLLNFTSTVDPLSDKVTSFSVTTTNPSDNFPMSYMWISSISFVVCLVIGYFGSWISSYFLGNSQTVSPDLLSPVLQWFGKKELKTEEKKINVSDDITITRF